MIMLDTNVQGAKIEIAKKQELILPAGIVAVDPIVTLKADVTTAEFVEPKNLMKSQRVRNIIRTMFMEDADSTEAQIVAAVKEAGFMGTAPIAAYVRGNIYNVQNKLKYADMNS